MLIARDFDRLKGVNPRLVAMVAVAATMTTQQFTVSEGVRTIEKQRQMVKEGKSKTMQSKHLSGDAVDIYPLTADRKAIDWQGFERLASVMRAAADKLGIIVEWGGSWKQFIDKPHWQI